MTAIVNLIYNGTTYRVLCDKVLIGGKKSIDVKPYANAGGPVEGQTLAYENLKYSITGIRYTGDSGTLTWPIMLEMYKQAYGGASATGENGPIVLNVTYGTSSLVGLEGSTDIKVLLSAFNFPVDAKDSRNGYLPIGSITLEETA